MADEQVLDTETAEQDSSTPESGPEPTSGQSLDELKAIAAKERKDRQKANREAQEAKKREAALQAELEAYKEKEMTEVEKATARAQKAEELLVAEREANLKLHRINILQASGVEQKYTDYLALELKKAQDSDPELKVNDWIEDFKKESPAFFGGGNGNAPPGSGAGGPATKSVGGKAAELQAVKSRLTELVKMRNMGNRSDATELEIANLSAKARALETELRN